MKKSPILVFILNCDWRDRFQQSFHEFRDKLERDQLNSEINSFFVFSWARISYVKIDNKFSSIHRKTILDKLRPLLDIWTIPLVLYSAWKYKLRPQVWLCYDFGFVPALWISSLVFGGKVVMCLNNQPRIYSMTRSFGYIKYMYSWFVEKAFCRLVEHFLTINKTMKSYIENLGITSNKISIFSMNTINRDMKYIDKMKSGLMREKYKVPENHKIIITVARLEAEKNYPLLLNLFSTLRPEYTLFILGRGSLLESLQQQVLNLGIQDRVHFMGFVHRDEIWNYYADSDVFVLLSKAEALGVVFWEAMYSNIPIIGSNVSGISESLGLNGERGLLWDLETSKAGDFQKLIDFCVHSSSKKDIMLRNARKYIDEQIRNDITINDII